MLLPAKYLSAYTTNRRPSSRYRIRRSTYPHEIDGHEQSAYISHIEPLLGTKAYSLKNYSESKPGTTHVKHTLQ